MQMILCKTFEKNCFPTKHCYVNTFQSGRNSLEWLNFWLQQSSYWNVNTTFLSSSMNWGWKWKLNWSTLLKNYHKRTTNVAPVRSIKLVLNYFASLIFYGTKVKSNENTKEKQRQNTAEFFINWIAIFHLQGRTGIYSPTWIKWRH